MIKIAMCTFLETDQIESGYDLTKVAVTFTVNTQAERGHILNTYAETWDNCKVYRVVDEIDDDMYSEGTLYITVVIECPDADFAQIVATDIHTRGWIE